MRLLLFLPLIIFSGNISYGQLKLVNIDDSFFQTTRLNSSVNDRVTATALPFFDDFATTNTAHPNTTYWLPGSGVYINNTLANTQPSLNFATFDGLNAAGSPYENNNQLKEDNTDTLTSQAINLAGLTPRDSVYLSFYWLAKGLGEKPDSSDVFRLEFKSNAGAWTQVWLRDGKVPQDSLFTQQFVAVADPAFFHADFQFRFRSYGRSSGAYDTWHLDYIYLDKNRSLKVPYIADVAMRRPLTPFLKQYSAIPLKQYLANPAIATATSVVADVKNNFDNPTGFNALSGTYLLYDQKTGHQYIMAKGAENVASLKSTTFKITTAPIVPVGKVDSLNLLSKFYLTTTDNKTPGVNLFRNDTISAPVNLSDYYAFDDGSAEYGVQVNQKLGRSAVRFVLARPDTLAGVRMCIVPFNKDISGQSFNIQVWSSKNGKPDQLLAQRSVAARYGADRNGFVQFPLTNAVALKDTFFVGWLQINEQPLVIGYDRSSVAGKDQVYFNLGSEWVKETALTGSLMIRPYMGGKSASPILGIEPADENAGYFFPNPIQSIFNWNESSLKTIEIYSSKGQLVRTVLPRAGERSATLDGLENGIYIFRALDGKRSVVQKMLIAK